MTDVKLGRPTIYSDELIDEICSRLSLGESMRSICRDDDMPAMQTIWRWLRENLTFSERYAQAKQESADAMAEDVLDIADNIDGNPVDINGETVKVIDNTSVQHAKLRVDTRKWLMAKQKPKKYGDSLAIGGSSELPSIKTCDISDDDLKAEIEKYGLK